MMKFGRQSKTKKQILILIIVCGCLLYMAQPMFAIDFKQTLEAAQNGDPKAQYYLGVAYSDGKGVVRDYNEACKWFKRAAEQGSEKSQAKLGVMYSNGIGVVRDYNEAFKWTLLAFKCGNTQSAKYKIYLEGKLSPQKKTEIENGVTAMFNAGLQAAQNGDSNAQNRLGEMYAAGIEVTQDYTEAIKWFKKSAEQGYVGAQYHLASRYALGHGVVQDYNEAYKWAFRAATQGNEDAVKLQNDLKGKLNKQEIAKIELGELVRQAETGDVESQCKLGLIYYNGQEVAQDYQKAHNWFNKAAEQGSAAAQYNLGVMYDKGQGIDRNPREAYKWISLAASQGDEEATKIKGLMDEKLAAQKKAETQEYVAIPQQTTDETTPMTTTDETAPMTKGDRVVFWVVLVVGGVIMFFSALIGSCSYSVTNHYDSHGCYIGDSKTPIPGTQTPGSPIFATVAAVLWAIVFSVIYRYFFAS